MEFIRRKVYFGLKAHLDQPEISLILGPRQSGKTTLMLRLKEELEKQGSACQYFNLDVMEDKQFFQTQHTLLDKIKQTVGREKAFVFIDEIQRLENAGLFLKGLYDLRTDYKFIVSGSGSLELKANIIEPMTGRKRIFFCLPLSFTEFSAYKLGAEFDKTPEMLKIDPLKTERITKEYLLFGGYPRVVLAATEKEKMEVLSEIFRSYLEKDIQLLLGVEKVEAFELLVRILADQVGNFINRTELASICGINEKTVEKYLFLLEKTFVISLVKPFFKNARKELRKTPKVYFLDLGFLSLAQRKSLSGELSGGFFENACFVRLKELDILQDIKCWRSSSGAEVDFVVTDSATGEPVPIEVKLAPSKRSLGKSLISFLSQYRPKNAFFYSKEVKGTLERKGTKIIYLPYYELPEI